MTAIKPQKLPFGKKIIYALGQLGWSDRSESKLGRRRKFMVIGAFPFAIFSVLVFTPPSEPGTINLIWIFISTILFYFFMTMYVTPFFALISELGHTTDERLQLSTMISVNMGTGFYGRK